MLVCAFLPLCNLAHETAGAACTRHSLLPLLSRGTDRLSKPRADYAARRQSYVRKWQLKYHTLVVMPREGGASSTPRLLRSSTLVSGILGRPDKPGEDNCERGAWDCVVAIRLCSLSCGGQGTRRSRRLGGVFGVLQSAAAPDRSREQHDDDAENGEHDFAAGAAIGEMRFERERPQQRIELGAERAGEQRIQLRMDRGIGGDDVAGNPSQQRRAGP